MKITKQIEIDNKIPLICCPTCEYYNVFVYECDFFGGCIEDKIRVKKCIEKFGVKP